MERMRSEDRSRAAQAVDDGIGGQLAARAGMLVFIIGLALLFVVSAPH